MNVIFTFCSEEKFAEAKVFVNDMTHYINNEKMELNVNAENWTFHHLATLAYKWREVGGTARSMVS